jgi:glycosyltransferase involved in cell wall biosynthesis
MDMVKNKSLISLVIPVYNEAGNLSWMHSQVVDYFHGKSYECEIIYINDGSRDDSLSVIKDIAEKDSRVKYVSFSRNFGKEPATSAGLRKSTGDGVVIIDADGQHPVQTIDDFIKEWERGAEVIVGIRSSNTKEGFVKKYGSKLFYTLLNSLNGGGTVRNSTDFRLIDRRVVNEFNKLTEHNRITRGLIDWLGYKRAYVSFVAPARHSGEASYSYKKLVKLAIHAFVSNSTKPLQIVGILGGLVMSLSAFIGIFLALETYLLNDPLHFAVTGTAILALFLSFLVGILLVCQWLLALYVESIHNETQNRPLYIVESEN